MSDIPTVYIVDDDEAVRDSLAVLVRAMNLQVACFDSAQQFLDECDLARPGCLVLDLRMPGMSGFDLQEHLVALESKLPIIIMTGHGDVPMSVRALKQGAIDFLEKPYRPQQMRESIRLAIEQDAKRREKYARQSHVESKIEGLTPDEKAVMEGIVAGKPNKVIASELDVSLRTVQFRRTSLMKKLGVDSKAALVQIALSVR